MHSLARHIRVHIPTSEPLQLLPLLESEDAREGGGDGEHLVVQLGGRDEQPLRLPLPPAHCRVQQVDRLLEGRWLRRAPTGDAPHQRASASRSLLQRLVCAQALPSTATYAADHAGHVTHKQEEQGGDGGDGRAEARAEARVGHRQSQGSGMEGGRAGVLQDEPNDLTNERAHRCGDGCDPHEEHSAADEHDHPPAAASFH